MSKTTDSTRRTTSSLSWRRRILSSTTRQLRISGRSSKQSNARNTPDLQKTVAGYMEVISFENTIASLDLCKSTPQQSKSANTVTFLSNIHDLANYNANKLQSALSGIVKLVERRSSEPASLVVEGTALRFALQTSTDKISVTQQMQMISVSQNTNVLRHILPFDV